MIDTGKYEPTQIDWMLHNTREHSPDGWRKLSKSLIELSNDDRLLIEYAPTLRAEVKRLREELDKAEQKRDKYDGALNIALEHLGYQDADHDEFCKEQYECNAYGDELLKCDIGCGGLLVNRYGDYVSTISLSESAGCEDEDCCNYYKGSEEE